MTFDAPPGVEHQNCESFALGIEVGIGDDICLPIFRRDIRRVTELKTFRSGTFPQGDQLPFLRLLVVAEGACALSADGFNRLHHRGDDGRLCGRIDIYFVGAHVFVFREGAGLLSSLNTGRTRPLRRNTPERPGAAWDHPPAGVEPEQRK